MGLGNVTKAIWTLLQGTTNPDVVALYNNLYQKLEGAKAGFSSVGTIFFVNAAGDNGNNGLEPSTPFQTITYALTQCTAGANDYIVVMNNTSAVEPAFPIDVAVGAVHIIGFWGEPYPSPSLMAVGNFATFQLSVDWVEIAGFELGAGAAHGCIESPAGPGTIGHWWIHNCSFGYIGGLMTARDGVWVQNTHDAPQCVIEDNIFGSALTRDGIRIEGNSTRSIFRRNFFKSVPTVGIHCIQNGSDIGAILDNNFICPDNAVGEAVTMELGVGNAIIAGNRAGEAAAAMGNIPYRDLSTGVAATSLNAWVMNYDGIQAIIPSVV